jgi:hypothetical protein
MSNPILTPNFFFNNVQDALAPLSAGTVYKVCVAVYNCDNTENNEIREVPHPVWTNEMGKSVVQLNMVTLGGPDGLNS